MDDGWRTHVPGLDDAELRALMMAQPRVIGDAATDNILLFYNLDVPVGNASSFYGHGGYNDREGLAGAWYRGGVGSDDIPSRNSEQMYPDGFVPFINGDMDDRTAILGHRARLDTVMRWDKETQAALFEAALGLSIWETTEFWATGQSPQPLGSANRMSAPYQAFRCADGYITIGAANDVPLHRAKPSNWRTSGVPLWVWGVLFSG